MWFSLLIALLTAYMLGNLNGAVCISALMHDDVRSHGSGNAGLTNFIRNYGPGQSFMVIAIDAGKAALACLSGGLILAPYGLYLEGAALCGVAVMLGHDFPALLGFRGGKGILSGWFIAWVLDWRVALLIGVVFFAVYLLTRYVSLGSILAGVTFSVAFAILYSHTPVVMVSAIFMGALTVFMHRSNIARLLKGEERRTDLFKKKTAQ